jgi:soluble lytic murein transglycosylase-like protein
VPFGSLSHKTPSSPYEVPRVLLRFVFVLLAAAACALVFICMRAPSWAGKLEEIAAMGRYRQFDTLIAETASPQHVDPAILKAIVWHESRFDPAKVDDGGYGLMQLGKGTGMEWAAAHHVESFMVTDLLDARTNLQAGAWYFRQLLDHWRNADDPVAFALAEYVAGPEAIQQWSGGSLKANDLRHGMKGTSTETFVDQVLRRARADR